MQLGNDLIDTALIIQKKTVANEKRSREKRGMDGMRCRHTQKQKQREEREREREKKCESQKIKDHLWPFEVELMPHCCCWWCIL